MSKADVGKVFNLTGGNGGDGSLKLEGLSVTKTPNKTTYKSGDTFDPTGMVVTGLYAYGITSDVTGYTYEPQVLTDGVGQVTITYTEGRITKTASVDVTVEKVLTSIEITTPPTKTNYSYLESFAPAGMVVTAKFSDGSSSQVTGYSYPSTAFSTLGTVSVEISYTYEGVSEIASVSVTVSAISVAVPTQKNIPTYDGTNKTPEWDNYDSVKMEISGNTSGINAYDNYSATFTLVYGYVFPDGSSSAIVNWSIKRQTISATPVQVDVPAADNTVKSPSWSGYDKTKMTISGDQSGTAAGDYTAVFTPTSNYMWWDGTTTGKSVTWTIASVLVTIPSQTNIPTYDGSSKTPEWTNFDTDHSTVTVVAASSAGSHTATFKLLDGMWADGTTEDKTITWTINRASISAVPTQSGSITYDENPHTPSWSSDYSTSKLTLSVEAKTNAGTYTASFTPTSNYQWWDGTTDAKTASWTIGKATYTPSASPSSVTLNSSTPTSSFTVTRKGDGTISAKTSDSTVATVGAINQTTGSVGVNSVNSTTGTAVFTVTIAESTNYKAVSFTVNITAQFVTIYGVEWDWTSSGPTNGTRTDAAANFSDPVPAVNNGTGSSPFDDLYPWSGMVKETRTGGVMVKEPKYYFKWTKTDKKLKLQIADGYVEGFYVDPVNMDRGDGLGELDYSYVGRYHCATSTYKSTSGVAQACSITRSAARTSIHNLGSYIWQFDFAQFWYIGMLYLVEFADWNGQTKIGYGCSASGSKENNGKTDSMGYHTGTTAANRTTYGYTQYRYIEGYWDNVYDWMDGCYYTSSGLNVILNPNNFSDTANGTLIGSMPSSGYPTEMAIPTQSGFEWALRPAATGGSQTTYVPDYWYFNGSSPCLFHGGNYSQDLGRGPFCVYCSGTSGTGAGIGCRLQERPPKAA